MIANAASYPIPLAPANASLAVRPPRTLMIFVDGLGIGPEQPACNPIAAGAAPLLRYWMRRWAVPVDAGLGVPGVPQSATGQASLFTGENAARFMGRHVEGLPGARLRDWIASRNLLSVLAARGYTVTFANGYDVENTEEVRRRRRISVTTVMALTACGSVRDRAALWGGRAVYHDLTRAALRARGYEGPLLEPETAAAHLLAIAREADFTLFEFFETDRAAHRGEAETVADVLRRLDRFLAALRPHLHRRHSLLVLTSDHGNIEDLSVRGHTTHPVPLIAFGAGADRLRAMVRQLTDFAPAILSLYPPRH